jgi:hypothetical protein
MMMLGFGVLRRIVFSVGLVGRGGGLLVLLFCGFALAMLLISFCTGGED